MKTLDIYNPFGAPVYYAESVTNTMDEARSLAVSGAAAFGTVIAAGYQSAGRGRSGRSWNMNAGESLPFTLILRYPVLPAALTLKAGLAVSAALEDFIRAEGVNTPPLGAGLLIRRLPAASSPPPQIKVKWPNDVMLLDGGGRSRKAAGILAEASGGTAFLGIGINVAQRTFPPELAEKACSLASVYGLPASITERRFELLEAVLSRLYEELEFPGGGADWRERLEKRLYRKGETVRFIPGLPEELSGGAAAAVEGILRGIGENGEILLEMRTGTVLPFVTGELKVY